ncbi:acyl-CoA dehydrogenase [Mycolicibacterium sp. PDY-3]|uniref:acyl-CoA dehydrogenase n=1 Tax=Mycolicibacterium sp. PDY-3 TaxID=3376069 RepID=UPI0037A0A972
MRQDLEFLLYDWLDIEQLVDRPRFTEHSRDTFDAVLDLSEALAATYFAPHNKKGDRQPPVLHPDGTVTVIGEAKTAVKAYASSGLIAAPFAPELGGMHLPSCVGRSAMALIQAANPSTSSYLLLTAANAALLAEYASAEQIENWLIPMVEGRYLGTMCLSEPQAGSSLADITTRAEPCSDGTYRLIGTKMWISAGDHDITENIVHLVLARIAGAPAGTRGLSLFIVPKVLPDGCRNDVTVTGLNHKMGNRGTSNTVLNFGEGGHDRSGPLGAVGYLVGGPNQGLAQMFHMMNDARIGVGFLAAAIGAAGYQASLRYARERTQGRPVGVKDAAAAPVALIDHADVRRMLLAQKSYVEGALALCLYCAKLSDDVHSSEGEYRERASLLLDVLTPIAKSWPAQWCLEANNLAIQVHGGYGYTTDFDVEQCYRDNRLNAIHEGTHGIQAQDLLGRKMVMNGGTGARALFDAIQQTIDSGRRRGGELARHAGHLDQVVARMRSVTEVLTATDDATVRMANASLYLEAVGHVVVSWMWLEQVVAAAPMEGGFAEGKRTAAHYFFTYELPKSACQFDMLATLDRTLTDLDPAQL